MVETAASPVRRRRRRRRTLHLRRLVALVLVVALVPVLYSYVTTMLKPSSVGLGVRSVEWVRANGGAGVVNTVERVYYTWTAPKKGGPALKLLPTVGATAVASACDRVSADARIPPGLHARARRRRRLAPDRPRRLGRTARARERVPVVA